MASSFEDGFMSIIDGTKSTADAFRSMAAEIIKDLYRVLVVQRIVAGMKGWISGFTGGLNLEEKTIAQAKGDAFSGGNVIPFASGGVVSSPTLFPMAAGRTGLMGEAGPEAIMPLSRGSDGKLGVKVSGGGNGVIINQVINVSTGVQQTVRAEVMGLMPQIADASKMAVRDAVQRGGSYGSVF